MDFDLRLLRHARALAEEGSFARASRTLHLTQPALSRSIQELERRTGIKLFDRNKGRVEPTDLGRMFLAQARELLGRAEALDRDVATMRGSGTGKLIVGSGTFPSVLFMPAALGAFLRQNPSVGVRLVNDNWAALVAAMRRRELDFVVSAPPGPEEATDLAVRPLSIWQGHFLVRSGHPLLSRPRLSLADVVGMPIISTGRLPAAMTEYLLEARRDLRRPLPDLACESHEIMRAVVRATDHVLLSSLAANAEAIGNEELVPLPLVDQRVSVAFAILRLQARTLPPIADELIEQVVQADRAAREADRALAARLRLAPPAPTAATRVLRRRRETAIGAARGTAPP